MLTPFSLFLVLLPLTFVRRCFVLRESSYYSIPQFASVSVADLGYSYSHGQGKSEAHMRRATTEIRVWVQKSMGFRQHGGQNHSATAAIDHAWSEDEFYFFSLVTITHISMHEYCGIRYSECSDRSIK